MCSIIRLTVKPKRLVPNSCLTFYFFCTDIELQAAPKSYKSIPNKYADLFISGKCVLDDVCTRLNAGTVTLSELSLMKDNMDHVSKLIAANFLKDEKEEKFVHKSLQQRLDEYIQFLNRKKRLALLCQHIDVPVEGSYASCACVNCFFFYDWH